MLLIYSMALGQEITEPPRATTAMYSDRAAILALLSQLTGRQDITDFGTGVAAIH